MSTPSDSSAKFDKFRRHLILKSRPVGKEERAEWFQQFSELVEKAFPGQECRINRPGVAHRMFAAEVAIPRMKPEQLVDFAREFEQLFLEAMPVTAEKLFTNAYQDRMDVMWEAAVDLGDSYVTMAVKLRNAEFGHYEFNQDDRGRGQGGERPERRPYSDRDRPFNRDHDRGRDDQPKPRRFDMEGNERPPEDRPRRFQKRPYGDNRGGGNFDRDRRPWSNDRNQDDRGGRGGNFDRERKPWSNDRPRDDRGYRGGQRDDNRGDNRGSGNFDRDRKPWNNDRNRGDKGNRGGGNRSDRDQNRGPSDRPWEKRDRPSDSNRPPDSGGWGNRDRNDSGSGSRKPFRPGGGGGKSFGKGRGPSSFKGKRNGPGKGKPKG